MFIVCDAEFGCENSGTLFKNATEVIFRKFTFFLSTQVRCGISRLELQTAHPAEQSHALFSHHTLCGQITKKKKNHPHCSGLLFRVRHSRHSHNAFNINIFCICLNGVEISRIFTPRFHSLSQFQFSLSFLPERVRIVCTHSTLHLIPRALRNNITMNKIHIPFHSCECVCIRQLSSGASTFCAQLSAPVATHYVRHVYIFGKRSLNNFMLCNGHYTAENVVNIQPCCTVSTYVLEISQCRSVRRDYKHTRRFCRMHNNKSW